VTREFHVEDRRRPESDAREWDAAIALIAARQHGVISRVQLIRIGLTPWAIRGRIRAGRLHPIHRGVYAVGHPNVSREGRYLAAVLASGEGAVLSHRSAADLWELRAAKGDEIDVIATTHRRGDRSIRIHRNALDPRDTMTRNGIRVTRPLRTLLDHAACVTDKIARAGDRQSGLRDSYAILWFCSGIGRGWGCPTASGGCSA
jgi:hypothetical protein